MEILTRVHELHPSASVLFAEVYNYESRAAAAPDQRVRELHQLYSHLDDVITQHGCYKITSNACGEIIVCCNVVEPSGQLAPSTSSSTAGAVPELLNHAEQIVGCARELIETAAKFTFIDNAGPVQLLVGVHTGSMAGGVIGKRSLSFDLFGEALFVARAAQRVAVPGYVQATDDTLALLRAGSGPSGYGTWVYRGAIPLGGQRKASTGLWMLRRPQEPLFEVPVLQPVPMQQQGPAGRDAAPPGGAAGGDAWEPAGGGAAAAGGGPPQDALLRFYDAPAEAAYALLRCSQARTTDACMCAAILLLCGAALSDASRPSLPRLLLLAAPAALSAASLAWQLLAQRSYTRWREALAPLYAALLTAACCMPASDAPSPAAAAAAPICQLSRLAALPLGLFCQVRFSAATRLLPATAALVLLAYVAASLAASGQLPGADDLSELAITGVVLPFPLVWLQDLVLRSAFLTTAHAAAGPLPHMTPRKLV